MSVLSQSKWTVQCLDELCDIVIGRTPSRAQLQYWGVGHYWLSISDMGSFRDIVRTKETITDAGAAICGNRLIHPGTVVLSFKLSIGKVGIVNVPMYTNEAIAALPVKDKSVLDEGYLYYALKVVNFTGRTDRAVMGQTLNTKKLQEIPIPLPPLEDQRHIATILDKADAVLRKRQQAITLTEELLRAAFLEMFGDPVTNPKGWTLTKLSGVCSKITDGTHHSPPTLNKGVPYITAKHLKLQGLEFFSDPWFISEEEHRKIYARCNPEKGDVLYIKDGATTGIAAINNYDFEFSMLSSLALLKAGRNITGEYLCDWLNNEGVKKNHLRNIAGAAITRLTLTKIKDFYVPVPPLSLQIQYQSIRQKIFELISNIKNQEKESLNLFNSLLQKAFRGEM